MTGNLLTVTQTSPCLTDPLLVVVLSSAFDFLHTFCCPSDQYMLNLLSSENNLKTL
ncbi:hypothetical protein NPIL_172701, partial [Nephila pilipes]